MRKPSYFCCRSPEEVLSAPNKHDVINLMYFISAAPQRKQANTNNYVIIQRYLHNAIRTMPHTVKQSRCLPHVTASPMKTHSFTSPHVIQKPPSIYLEFNPHFIMQANCSGTKPAKWRCRNHQNRDRLPLAQTTLSVQSL